MSTVLDKGTVALAEKLGLDLHFTKFIHDAPFFTPCRCTDGPWLWKHSPETCFRCGRYIEAAVGQPYDLGDQEGLALLEARIEVERIKVLGAFRSSGADDYEQWLEVQLAETERVLERCAR